jgi:hypothetical protein
MSDISSWITLAAAALSPIIAIAGVAFAHGNIRLARRRRDDELFDRRYEFYQRLRSMWLQTGNGAPHDSDPSVDIEDLIPIAEEAGFLFDDAIAQHVLSLAGDGHSGHPDFPDEWFVTPFRPYLSLERPSRLQRVGKAVARRLRQQI